MFEEVPDYSLHVVMQHPAERDILIHAPHCRDENANNAKELRPETLPPQEPDDGLRALHARSKPGGDSADDMMLPPQLAKALGLPAGGKAPKEFLKIE